ncbi:MAG: dNTP triphosphohydrolase [Acidobacteria bacterium]|nr:dNTP triphosphohydrolase [Acidobacteriota bacterium]
MKWTDLLNAGRRRTTTCPNDPRVEFERDFDRSVFSTPVKRLQDKAQVFPLEAHDGVRTRLTHSLEVSSVARGLATRTAECLLKQGKISPGMDRYIEAIAATCGLIHDLGNPPFGHAGEDAIRAWFRRPERERCLRVSLETEQQIQDFLQFEGNAQSLRLVAKLQVLADDKGLNLTFGTLSALCKYTASSDEAEKGAANHACRKPGYFASEQDVVQQIRAATGTGEARHPICFLVEAADDIVYLAADVEDAVKKGVLSWREVEHELQAFTSDSVKEVMASQASILRAGRTEVPADLDDDIKAAAFRTAAIGIMSEGAFQTFQGKYADIMEGKYLGTLLHESDASELAHCLRNIGRTRVYPTRSTLTLELMGRRVIGDLMDVLWEGAAVLPREGELRTNEFAGKAAALISRNYRQVFRHSVDAENGKLPEAYHRFQLVTDYICGMTDSFAKRLHAELFNGR